MARGKKAERLNKQGEREDERIRKEFAGKMEKINENDTVRT